LGLHQTGGAIGSFTGPFITGVLVFAFGWRPAAMILAVPGLLIASKLWFSMTSESSDQTTPHGMGKTVALNWKTFAPAAIFIVAAFIYILGLRGTDAFANQYFDLGRGIQIVEASFLFSMLKVAGLFSAPVCGKLSDIFGRKKVLITLVAIESVSLYAITISPNLLLAFPCIVFGFASFGLLAVGEALLADVTPEKHRATVFGLNVTVNFSPSIFLIPMFIGLVPSFGFNFVFILLSAIMPLSIPLLLLIKTKSSQQDQKSKF
jgi:MFS family permease